MKAAVYYGYGEPDLVTVTDLPDPICPKDGCIVKVKACSVNPADWKYVHGNWKWVTGGRFPRQTGTDFAGVIETVGPGVKEFQLGDKVFGSINPFRTGTAAEYVAVKEKHIARMPPNLDFYEAAGIPIAGGTAYIGFGGHGGDLSGKRVLITGAGGGVGHLAVQLAKLRGGHVTVVCSAEKKTFCKRLGADEVIDYRETAPETLAPCFDIILDCAASLDYRSARRLLKNAGEYILLELNGRIQLFAVALLSRFFASRRMRTYLASPNGERCRQLAALFESGSLRIEISERYPLDRAAEALTRLKSGHAKAKIVIDIPNNGGLYE
jgi:NADPH:quinone reductase-like Zn-dependent oxidoreductase